MAHTGPGWLTLGLVGVGIVLAVIGVDLIGVTEINLVTGKQSSPDLGEGIVLIVVAIDCSPRSDGLQGNRDAHRCSRHELDGSVSHGTTAATVESLAAGAPSRRTKENETTARYGL